MTDKERFDSWLKQEYRRLHRELTDEDSLHDAYIIVVRKRNNVSNYDTAVNNAYKIARRYYQAYAMRFLLPDPLFWIYNAFEIADDIEEEQQSPEQPQEDKVIMLFLAWARRNCKEKEYDIVRMFYIEHLQVSEIAKLTGLSKRTIVNVIEDICERYRYAKYNKHAKDDTV